MIELLNSIVNFLISIIIFIYHSFKAILSFLISIPQYVNFISYSIGFIPDFLLPFAIFSVYLTILLMIIKKEP